ncbi:MAG: hypothetical protein K1060chlam4_00608 [Candidatus Anoxychlamydiales bacterium]|nr:hypothetical protein [Candidatus Anoxychlamydiales bacterium]
MKKEQKRIEFIIPIISIILDISKFVKNLGKSKKEKQAGIKSRPAQKAKEYIEVCRDAAINNISKKTGGGENRTRIVIIFSLLGIILLFP